MARQPTDGDVTSQRMRSAAVRACSAFSSSRQMAERVDHALDDITAPHRIQTGAFDEEDSVVTTLAEVVERKG